MSAPPDHRRALIRLQRDLFERNRELIARHEQAITPDFEAYERGYLASTAAYEREATVGEVMRAIRAAPITLVGDHHTLALSQKTFVKIARRVRGQRTTLALEFFAAADQAAIDAWMAGRINDKTMLKRTHYRKRWPYEIWSHFKPILELARRRGWRVLGLDPTRDHSSTLAEADLQMAVTLLDHLRDSPGGTRVLVLVGEMHLAETHLPAAVARVAASRAAAPPTVVSILQNPEQLYWQLAADRRTDVAEIVRVGDGRFGVLNTPPTVIQQSYLNWIEAEVDTLDYEHLTANFRQTLGHIGGILGVGVRLEPDELLVVGPGDLEGFEELVFRGIVPNDPAFLALDESAGRCRVFARQRAVCLGSLSLNRVGEAAGRLLHCMELGVDEEEISGFYARIVHEAMAFFGSKVLNPKRKARHEGYYRQLLDEVQGPAVANRASLEVASAILLHRDFERGRRMKGFHRVFELEPATSARLTRDLGKMLGERLYYAFVQSKARVSRAELRSLLRFRLDKPEPAAALYFGLRKQLGKVGIPRRI